MELFKALSPLRQVVLAGTLLFVVFSFFDWQQACSTDGTICVGLSAWHGIGVIAGILAIALLAWEVSRLAGVRVQVGKLAPALITAGLALGLTLLTIISVLVWNEARHWPQWIGLILALAIAGAAATEARKQGVAMPSRG
jgi:multidrug transporter EmrE-like cation transporter